MARTASQIVAERKLIEASRNAIHQRQMAEVGAKNAARTYAVLAKSANSTKDPVRKAETSRAARSVLDEYVKLTSTPKKESAKTAQDMQKKKEDRAEAKSKKDAMYSRKATAEKALQDYLDSEEQQKKNADRAARAMVYGVADEGGEYKPDETLRRLQDEARRAGDAVTAYENARTAERNARIAERDSVENWSDEDKAALEQYINDKQSAFVQSLNPAATGLPADFESNPLIAKYGRQRLDQIASTYQRQQNKQKYEAAQTAGQNAADNGAISAIGANAASIGANLADTLLNPLTRIAQSNVGRDDRYSTLDPYAGGQAAAYASGVRQKTAENIAGDEYDEQGNLIKEGGTGRQIGSYIYQGGMSALDSGARALVTGTPAVGAGLAALGSFNQTLREASEKGATAGEAVALATVNSAIEAATEKLPLDNLFDIAKAGAKPVAKVVMNILKQAGIEILEEEAALVGTTLAEAAILREKSGYNQQITEAMANGATEEQARTQALKNFLAEALNIAITSGISGGFGGAGAGITGAINSKLNDTQAARQQQTQTVEPVQTETTEAFLPDADLMDTSYLLDGIRQEQADQKSAADSEWMQQTIDEAMAQKKAQEEEALARENAQQADAARQKEKDRQKLAYEALQAEIRKQRDLEKQIAKAEQKLKETGKGSQARIDQLKTELQRQKDIIAQKQKFLNFREGNYDTNLESAIDSQQKLFDEAKLQANLAIADYNDGRITENQLKDAKDTYNNAGDELYRLKNMTPEQYRMELASIGLIGDLTTTNKPVDNSWMSNMFQTQNAEQSTKPVQQTQQTQQTAAPKDSTPTADMQMGASNQSAESGQIKGTGAAEADFSGKPAYNATLSADNAQADRRTDVRPMELPKQDVNGGNISAVTGNVYGSQNTPDDLASAMEEPTARGDFSYIPISNDEATQRAQKTIEDAGSWATAEQNFHDDVRDGKAGAEISARGALILNHAAEVYQQAKQTGNPEATKEAQTKWLSILSDLRQLGTNTAQGLQAMRIIRSLMPEDKLEFAKTAVRNMVRDMKLKTPIQIDENLLTEYENATTDEQRDEVIGKIQKNVAEQIPSTLLDKWNALRYTNMLGNLKTQGRNFAGNVGSTIAYRVKDAAGAAIEILANSVSGGKVGRTKSVIVSIPLQKACGAYYQKVKTDISSGGKFSENRAAQDDFTQGVMDERRIFKSNAKNETVRKVADFAMAPMEAYRKGTNWMMNNKYFGDEAFGKAAFTHAMAGYLQANGVKTEADMQKADPALIDKAMAYAVKEAQETTFHDNSALARVFGKLKKDMGVVGEGILPFPRTPANVLTRAEEFSPLGIINTAVLSAQKAAGNTKLTEANGRLGSWAERGQDITGTDIINSLSKSLTGSMIFALGAVMKGNGMLSAGADEDEEKAAFDKEVGKQEYAIVMPDGTSYTFDWATPEALPLFMGAQFMELWQQREDGITFADLEKVFTSIADPMIQMSMLQGINDSLDSIKYADSNLIEFVLNASLNYLTQGLTNTLMGQIEKSTEETRQTTYVDKDSEIPAWMQRAFGKASQKIPGRDFQQTDYINARGETEQQRTDALGWIYNLTSPGYLKKADVGEVEQELYRLHDATGENVFPESPSTTLTWTDKTGTAHKDYNLTAEQAETLKRETGQNYMRIIGNITKSKDYAALTDAQKAEAFKTAESYARMTAQIAAIGDQHTGYDDSWMMEMDTGKEAEYIIRRVTKSDLTNTMSALNTAWDKGYDTASRSDDLKWAYDTFTSLSDDAKADARKQLTGTAAKYVEAREKGVSHDGFLSAAKNVDQVKGTGTNGYVRNIDRREAIAKTSGLSQKEIDVIMRAYMTDYNPNSSDPEYSELKYDYLRQVLKLTPAQYAATYRAALDNEKEKTDYKAIMRLGFDEETAKKIAKVYNGDKKTKKKYIDHYEKTH